MSIYAKEFLEVYFAFSEFGHLMWGSVFPVIVFTDNRSTTRFFQTKLLLPPLWNACDFVLQYNFVIAHVAGAMNTAADFLSRAEINPTEKFEMKRQNDVITQAIEVTIQSTGVAEEKTLNLLIEGTPTEKQLWEERNTFCNAAKTETHNDPKNEVAKLQSFHEPQPVQLTTEKATSKITQRFD